MKKSQIFSKRYSIEVPSSNFFCPEVVGESDVSQKTAEFCCNQGFSLSETASEDSCGAKQKSMGLSCDGTGDAVNSVASLVKSENPLTRHEKQQLRKQLKFEIRQVHSLILRLEARELELKECLQMPKLENNGSSSKSVHELSPISGETCQNEGRTFQQPRLVVCPGGTFKEKRTPKANQFYPNADFVLGKDRMPFSEKAKTKSVSIKRSLALKEDMLDTKRQKIDTNKARKLAELMRQCGTILRKLMFHKFGWIFNEPVDVVKLSLHDYLDIIEKPMDLGTIKSKLESKKYETPLEFAEDVRLTFANAMKYNPKGHDVHIMADVLRMLFEDRWRSLDEKLKHLNLDCDITMRELRKPHEMMAQDAAPLVCMRRSRSSGPLECHNQSKPRFLKRRMTHEEKQNLSKMLEDLPFDILNEIMPIIRRRNPNLRQTDGEVEVDIDSFDSESLWELYTVVTNYYKAKKPIQQVLKQSQDGETIQVQQPGGALTSSEAAFRGGEEEVDIGVDMPSTSFPPIDIDKDVTIDSKCTSPNSTSDSSSSSSDSESSSSDSDSDSSSSGESDTNDALSPDAGSKFLPSKVDPPPLQEPVGSGAVREQRGSPALKMDCAKRNLSDLEGEVSLTRSSAASEELIIEGESAKPKHRLSPEKLLRAALLKNRFADTILKAHEKTLPLAMSDKADPEKLRRVQEELEKRQREEKARIQAEAKAAETARKKAEADAAAEVRRQREAEREAARLMLQQMEKTVQIGENSDFLKDLEMLRVVPLEHILVSDSVDEVSLSYSPQGLTRLDLQNGNPLEQLGLFMKVDEDDQDQDEEGEIED